MNDVIGVIEARFRSGNSIPVERTHITVDEFSALQQQLAAAREALQAAEAALHDQRWQHAQELRRAETADAEAARYRFISKRWQHQKTSESELFLMTLGLEGDVTGQLDDIIDATLQRDRQP